LEVDLEHFDDKLKYNTLDYNNIVNKLEILLDVRGFFFSPYEIINENFGNWKDGFNYLNLYDLQEKTGVSEIISNAKANRRQISQQKFIFYLEYVLFVLKIPSKEDLKNLASFVFEESEVYNIIDKCLNYMGCKVLENDKGCFIVPKDGKTELATQITKRTYNLNEDMWLFNHSSIKNNLIKKADILCRLYKYIEPKKSTAKQYGFDNLYEDISKLMDGLDIRHAPNKKEKEILNGMTKKELLEWYNQVFDMCVSLIIMLDYTAKRKDIKDLKSKL
jgi:hypothetical protein